MGRVSDAFRCSSERGREREGKASAWGGCVRARARVRVHIRPFRSTDGVCALLEGRAHWVVFVRAAVRGGAGHGAWMRVRVLARARGLGPRGGGERVGRLRVGRVWKGMGAEEGR